MIKENKCGCGCNKGDCQDIYICLNAYLEKLLVKQEEVLEIAKLNEINIKKLVNDALPPLHSLYNYGKINLIHFIENIEYKKSLFVYTLFFVNVRLMRHFTSENDIKLFLKESKIVFENPDNHLKLFRMQKLYNTFMDNKVIDKAVIKIFSKVALKNERVDESKMVRDLETLRARYLKHKYIANREKN